MDLDRHDFQLEELIQRIQKNDNRLVALQVPEGLKMQALEMMDEIESGSGAKVVLAADPCYGACDLVHDKMKMMGAARSDSLNRCNGFDMVPLHRIKVRRGTRRIRQVQADSPCQIGMVVEPKSSRDRKQIH